MKKSVDYIVTGPDGTDHVISGPEDATPQEVEAAASEMLKPGKWESLGRGAMQGATFGFQDEIYGGLKGAYEAAKKGNLINDFVSEYEKARDQQRLANDLAQDANPLTYMAGEIGGGVAMPLGATKTAAKLGLEYAAKPVAQSLKKQIVNSGATGAALSGVYGLGTSEGDWGDKLTQAGVSAAVGGPLAAAVPAVVPIVSSALSVPINAAKVAAAPKRFAAEKYAQAMSRDQGQEALQAGVNPFLSAEKKLTDAAARGDTQLMLGDVGGTNTKDLIRSAADMPNARKERFNEQLNRRSMVQSRNLEDAITKDLADGKNFYKATDDLIKEREIASDPLFKEAYATETPVTMRLKRVLVRPEMKDLMKITANDLKNRGEKINKMSLTQQLHEMKLQLDEQIGAAKLAEKTGNSPAAATKARTLTILKKDFLNSIDNKKYKEALKAFAGPSSLKRAAEDGFEDALSMAPEQIKTKLSNMTQSEIDLWRQGAARALIDKVRQGNIMRDRTKSIFDTPDMGLRLKEIFPSDKARRKFLETVNSERIKYQTREAVQGNSKTAKFLTAAQEAGKPAEAMKSINDLAQATTGNIGAIQRLLERGTNFASGLTPRVAAEILDIASLRAGQPYNLGNLGVKNALERVQAQKARQDLVKNALVPLSGVGSAVAQDNEPGVLRGGFGPRWEVAPRR